MAYLVPSTLQTMGLFTIILQLFTQPCYRYIKHILRALKSVDRGRKTLIIEGTEKMVAPSLQCLATLNKQCDRLGVQE